MDQHLLAVLTALIGASGTIIAAAVASRGSAGARKTKVTESKDESPAGMQPMQIVLVFGFALTALLVTVLSLKRLGQPALTVETLSIAAHNGVNEDDIASFKRDGLIDIHIPSVPAASLSNVFTQPVAAGCKPIVAWHEIVASHPTVDFLYSVTQNVSAAGLVVSLRARQEAPAKSYAYIRFFVLCDRS